MVFYISVVLASLVVLWGVIDPAGLGAGSAALLSVTTKYFGWFYLVATLGFLSFVLYLAFSRHGNVKLGLDDDEPKYGNRSWFAMLFSAGMGIGLVFWGVAEPVSHYQTPPPGVLPQTPEAARAAMRYAFFHWGLHAWAIYTTIALCIAYFSFRKGRPSLISSTFYPLLGKHAEGPAGKAIDILAILATVFGVATSLGFGTMQISGGLAHLTAIPATIGIQLWIIGIVTLLYMLSALTGLDRGIKILSNVNLMVAAILLLFALIAGPTAFLLDVFTTTLGGYIHNLIPMSLRLTPFSEGTWVADWTIFYWAWWIAWAPFVGMFIARISRGRTIREFVLGVLLVPSLFSFVWFSTFGGTALHLEALEHQGIAAAVEEDITSALFITLQQLPLGALISALATVLIVTFFITSADSATFVLGMLSSEGRLTPTNRVKLVWGLLQSSIAAVLLLSGGLQGLQTAAIVAAAPFAVIMVLMCVALMRSLGEEDRLNRERERARRHKLDELLQAERTQP
ncbi:glycine betaine uptake BCCT transporter [Candidatus Laterigemmans baculatus]|uniref:glycine betaine uptake BCCT transporter n=1 Tax=Candidatus Laterigemmans baculatus TaxID=2770505 RepID=UPI0013DCF7BC|nr:BCCT family transporter [Candidatus Laterigemmans baculatus]